MNNKAYHLKKPHFCLALGMSIGLTITGSTGIYRLHQRDFNHQKLKCQDIYVIKDKPQTLRATFGSNGVSIEMDPAVQRLLAGFENLLAFLQKIETWVEFFYNRIVSVNYFSNMESGFKKVMLTPIASELQMQSRDKLFLLQGSDRLVIKLKLAYGNGKQLERCLVIAENQYTNEVDLVEILPISRILSTTQGLYFIRKLQTMEATAYYPGAECTGIFCDGLTSTGKKAGYGVVAVDPKIIPLGTRLYIKGYGFAAAEDVGAAIKGNRIDLCFNTYREAVRFGRKPVKVYFID